MRKARTRSTVSRGEVLHAHSSRASLEICVRDHDRGVMRLRSGAPRPRRDRARRARARPAPRPHLAAEGADRLDQAPGCLAAVLGIERAAHVVIGEAGARAPRSASTGARVVALLAEQAGVALVNPVSPRRRHGRSRGCHGSGVTGLRQPHGARRRSGSPRPPAQDVRPRGDRPLRDRSRRRARALPARQRKRDVPGCRGRGRRRQRPEPDALGEPEPGSASGRAPGAHSPREQPDVGHRSLPSRVSGGTAARAGDRAARLVPFEKWDEIAGRVNALLEEGALRLPRLLAHAQRAADLLLAAPGLAEREAQQPARPR